MGKDLMNINKGYVCNRTVVIEQFDRARLYGLDNAANNQYKTQENYYDRRTPPSKEVVPG